MKFAAKILKVNEFTKFFDNKITKITTIMAKVFNSNSSSSFRVGRKVKKIVSQIQSLIEKHCDHCWYDGKWYFQPNIAHVYETPCLSILYVKDGVLFLYEDPFGNRNGRIFPYNGRLYSKLRALQQLIWVSPAYHTKKEAPKWALKYGRNYR